MTSTTAVASVCYTEAVSEREDPAVSEITKILNEKIGTANDAEGMIFDNKDAARDLLNKAYDAWVRETERRLA